MTFGMCLQLSPALKSAIGNDSQRLPSQTNCHSGSDGDNKHSIACALRPNNNNRKISNFVHLLVCGDINLGCICFEITFHLRNLNYFAPNAKTLAHLFYGHRSRLKEENEL